MGDVWQVVQQQLNGKYWDAIERVVYRLPCANTHPDVPKMSEADIIDTFWDKFKTFCNKTEN